MAPMYRRIFLFFTQIKRLQSYVTWIMRSLVEKVGYKPKSNDDHLTKMLRPTMMYWGCRAGVENCVDYVNNEFNEWLDSKKK